MSETAQIQAFLRQGEILKAERVLHSLQRKDASLLILDVLIRVFHIEAMQEAEYTVFDDSVDIQVLSKHFITLKLLVRRLEFGLPQEDQDELLRYCRLHHVSEYLLAAILLTNIFHRKRVCRKMMAMFPEKAAYFGQTYRYLEETEHG